eukprot:5940766-Lingulodinium_polyedra.AAC.1
MEECMGVVDVWREFAIFVQGSRQEIGPAVDARQQGTVRAGGAPERGLPFGRCEPVLPKQPQRVAQRIAESA